MRRALRRGQDPRLPAPLHRRGGGRGGRDARARAARTPSSPPTASTATRCCAGVPMERDHGRDVRQARRLLARPRRLDAPVRRGAGASTAATRSSAAGCRSPWASRSPTKMRGEDARHGLLLRRRRGGRGRVPRVDEPRGAVEAAGAVPLREQPLRDGHGARALRVADRPVREGGGLRHGGARAWTAWTWSRCTRRRRRACAQVRAGGGPVFLEFRTYRFRAHSMFDPELYRDKAEVEQWKKRGPIHTFSARLKAQGELTEERSSSRSTRDVDGAKSSARSPSPRPGTWEPVEDLAQGRVRRHDDHLPRSAARGPARGAGRATSACS